MALVFEELFDPPLVVLAGFALFMDDPPVGFFDRLPYEAVADDDALLSYCDLLFIVDPPVAAVEFFDRDRLPCEAVALADDALLLLNSLFMDDPPEVDALLSYCDLLFTDDPPVAAVEVFDRDRLPCEAVALADDALLLLNSLFMDDPPEVDALLSYCDLLFTDDPPVAAVEFFDRDRLPCEAVAVADDALLPPDLVEGPAAELRRRRCCPTTSSS